MQSDAGAKNAKIFFSLAEQRVGVAERDFLKVDVRAGPNLGRDGQVHRDHVCDLWITADGLAITEQENRLAAWRNLDRARRDWFGKQIAGLNTFEGGSGQPRAHAIGIRRD